MAHPGIHLFLRPQPAEAETDRKTPMSHLDVQT